MRNGRSDETRSIFIDYAALLHQNKEMALLTLPSLRSPIILLRSKPPVSPPQRPPDFLPVSISPPDHDDVTGCMAFPSLASANIVFFKSGYDKLQPLQVVVEEGESAQLLARRFKKLVLRSWVLQECERRMQFESTRDKRKRKAIELAAKKQNMIINLHPFLRKRKRKVWRLRKWKPESPNKKKYVYREEDDNWELPPHHVQLPYTNKL